MSKFRYLLFGYDTYYPCGGMNDFEFGFNTLDEFINNINKFTNIYEYYHVLDLKTFCKLEFTHNKSCSDLELCKNRMIKTAKQIIEAGEK